MRSGCFQKLLFGEATTIFLCASPQFWEIIENLNHTCWSEPRRNKQGKGKFCSLNSFDKWLFFCGTSEKEPNNRLEIYYFGGGVVVCFYVHKNWTVVWGWPPLCNVFDISLKGERGECTSGVRTREVVLGTLTLDRIMVWIGEGLIFLSTHTFKTHWESIDLRRKWREGEAPMIWKEAALLIFFSANLHWQFHFRWVKPVLGRGSLFRVRHTWPECKLGPGIDLTIWWSCVLFEAGGF